MNSGFPGLLGFGDPILLNQSSNFNPSTNQSSTQNQHSIFNYFNPSSNYQSDRKIKVKRTRQRVDAGQPRNTYSTVPGQNHQMRSAIPTGKAGPPYLSNHNGPSDVISDFNQANFFGTTNSGWSNGSYPSQNNLTMDRMISQMIGNSLATQIRPGSVPVSAGVPHHAYPPVNGSSTLMSGNNMQMAQLLRFQAIMASNAAAEIKQNMAVKTEHQLVDCEPPMQSTATDLSVKTWHRNTPTPALSTESVTDSGSHLCSTSTTSSPDRKMDLKTPLDWGKTSSSNSSTVSHKSKRKQYLPQPTPQMDSERDFDPEIEEYDDVDLSCDDLITDSGDSPLKKRKRNVQDTSPSGLESPDDLELKAMQQEIVMMQQRFAQLLKARGQCETPPGLNISPSRNMKMLKNEVDDEPNTPENDRKPGEMKSLGHHLRRELTTNVESTVDNVLSQNLGMVERARSSYIAVQQTAIQMQQQASMAPNQTPYREWAQSQKNLYLNYCIALTSYANAASGLNSLGSAAAQSTKSNGIFPKGPVVHQAGLLGHAPFAPPPSSTGGGLGAFPASTSSYSHPTTHDGNIAALPLLVKKRRSKVTDSRISKVSATGAPYPFQASPLSLEESFRQTGFDRTFQAPPSMVPSGVISSPHSTGHGMELDGLVNSPRSNSDGTGSEIGNCYHEQLTSTLTPIHLRKAKLMFFYVRYPSSQILKAFFPDILFDKNNTAQLVKWFSNFREFYYIQMEKYARQALAEGIRSSDEITVNVDSELYRVLNVHYNRNNHIQVPTHFREVVEATLREFFKSLQANRDAEQAWKKTIYKIIARLDQTVPEYFKTTSFMEQLGFPDQ